MNTRLSVALLDASLWGVLLPCFAEVGALCHETCKLTAMRGALKFKQLAQKVVCLDLDDLAASSHTLLPCLHDARSFSIIFTLQSRKFKKLKRHKIKLAVFSCLQFVLQPRESTLPTSALCCHCKVVGQHTHHPHLSSGLWPLFAQPQLRLRCPHKHHAHLCPQFALHCTLHW